MSLSISRTSSDTSVHSAISEAIKIRFNNQITYCPKNTTVEELLKREFDNCLGIAVALNYIVVPPTQWKTSVLYENDILDCFMAIAGG